MLTKILVVAEMYSVKTTKIQDKSSMIMTGFGPVGDTTIGNGT
jgi:hypothetical protein